MEIKNPEDPTKLILKDDKILFSTIIESPNGEKMRIFEFNYSIDDHKISYRKTPKGTYKLDLDAENPKFKFLRTVGRNWDLPQPVKFHGFSDQTITYYQNTSRKF